MSPDSTLCPGNRREVSQEFRRPMWGGLSACGPAFKQVQTGQDWLPHAWQPVVGYCDVT